MFYKYENEDLMYGPSVMYPDGTLLHLDHLDEITLPYDGWYFFNTIDEARDFFGLKND